MKLTLSVADPEALRALYEKQLALGRVFLPGEGGVVERTACELVVEHAGRSHVLAAEVVFVKAEDPGRGLGLQLAPLDADGKEALRAFVHQAPDAPGEDDAPAEPPPSSRRGEDAEGDGAMQSVQERIRGMTQPEQVRLAASGSLPERVILERMYGATVWEALLRNPRLTVPEVARIGKKGTLPRPLVEMIAANPSWLTAGEVQRALLGNPRSSPAVIEKVLRSMSRNDLLLVPQQTAYPAAVRQAAKRMLTR